MIYDKRVIALLPMKANSERVPGKNFRNLAGKPLFEWILGTLISIPAIDQVVINTDAHHLLEGSSLIASEKILMRNRQDHIRGDQISMNLIIKDDLENISGDIFLMTHTTNPFLSKKTISNAITRFDNSLMLKQADSLFSVNKIQSRFYDRAVNPLNHDPKNLIPTQELEPWYEENSNLYLFTAKSFGFTGARIGSAPIMFETPRLESIDIDTEEDWSLAEIAATYFGGEGLANK